MMQAASPLGPIWRAVISALWKRLFNASASNQLYLPRIIREGYKPWGLPPYDPATPSGVSQAFPLPGVPQEVADSACSNPDLPIAPIASDEPTLQLLNVLLTNLSQMQPSKLTFSDTNPQFTGVVVVGTTDKPLTISAADEELPNYYFQVACCVPANENTRTCSDVHWPATAQGRFTAMGADGQVALTLQLNATGSDPVTVTIVDVAVTAAPSNVTVDFDVQGLPKWAQQMADIAVQEGVGSGAITGALSAFLNQTDVKEHLETLIDNTLKELPAADLTVASHL